MRPRLRFLSDEPIERILDEAYKLLETKGVALHHESLPRRLAEAGCLLDAEQRRDLEGVMTAVAGDFRIGF